VNVAAEVSGRMTALNVENGQYVHKGDLLFSIDPTPYLIALHAAEAQNALAQKNADSIIPLADQKYLPKIEKDKVEAALKESEAALASARMNMGHTKYYAPFDGFVSNVNTHKDSVIALGEPLFVLIDSAKYWILANFKETQLRHIKPQQPVEITIDMYPGKVFHGIVSSIGHGSGTAFALLPSQNATGNWVKITQRFPVRIDFVDLPKDHHLRVGSSCEVKIMA
jgi:membrane fusion protein (multidrug efflux system)